MNITEHQGLLIAVAVILVVAIPFLWMASKVTPTTRLPPIQKVAPRFREAKLDTTSDVKLSSVRPDSGHTMNNHTIIAAASFDSGSSCDSGSSDCGGGGD